MINIAKPIINDEEIKAVTETLKSGMLAEGKQVQKFQEEFAKYSNAKYGVATSSGTTALHSALLAANVQKDDEVITTPFTFAATSNSVLYCGAKPVFCDIDPKTFNIDPSKIEEHISDNTKAILPVHLYGQPADMDSILKIAKKYDIKVIEDACQAHGSEYKGQKVGAIGDIGCFSFYPTKNMTTGEGGMVLTNDENLREKTSLFHAHGESKRYEQNLLGYNYRMTDIAASIGLEQLKKIEEFNSKRISNAKYLSNNLKEVNGLITPEKAENTKHVYHQYTLRISENRNKFQEFLKEKGIGTGIHYPIVLYNQPYYKANGFTGSCHEAEKAAEEVLSIPVHPSLTKAELDTVIDVIKKASNTIL